MSFDGMYAPFNKKLKEGQARNPHTLTKEDPRALATLQDKLKSESVLKLPLIKGHLALDTVVCDKWAGCALMQE